MTSQRGKENILPWSNCFPEKQFARPFISSRRANVQDIKWSGRSFLLVYILSVLKSDSGCFFFLKRMFLKFVYLLTHLFERQGVRVSNCRFIFQISTMAGSGLDWSQDLNPDKTRALFQVLQYWMQMMRRASLPLYLPRYLWQFNSSLSTMLQN